MIKRFIDWQGDLGQYLSIGDEVDEEMVQYFINILPPATMNGELVQMGEPFSHEYDSKGELRATYPTLKSNSQYGEGCRWYYAGNCFRGEADRK